MLKYNLLILLINGIFYKSHIFTSCNDCLHHRELTKNTLPNGWYVNLPECLNIKT